MPRSSTARTPSSIAERMASVRARSRAISVIRSWSWSADRLTIRASSPSSSLRRTRLRACRSPWAKRRAASITSLSGPASGDDSAAESSAVSTKATASATATARWSSAPCSLTPRSDNATREMPTTAPWWRMTTAA